MKFKGFFIAAFLITFAGGGSITGDDKPAYTAAKQTINERSPFNTVNPEIAAYYGNEAALSWLISAKELKALLDDKAMKDKVIILSDSGINNIPGAMRLPVWNSGGGADNGSVVTQNRFVRNEGPIANDYQIINGVNIDDRLQTWGVKKDSIIVLTSAWNNSGAGTNVAGWFWYLSYWGFSKNNLKVLDGGNEAYRVIVGEENMTAVRSPYPTEKSKFSVREIPGDRFGIVRHSLGQIIEAVKNNDYLEGRKLMFSTLTNAMGSWFKDENGKDAVVNFYGFTYGGKIRGQKFIKNIPDTPGNNVTVSSVVKDINGVDRTVYRYKTTEELKTVIFDREIPDRNVTILPEDRSASIVIYCGSGTTTVPYFMSLQMAGYYNTAIFGGNASGWFSLGAYEHRNPTDFNLPVDNSTRADHPYGFQANLGMANSLISPATQFLKYNNNNTFSIYDSNSKPTGRTLDPAKHSEFLKGIADRESANFAAGRAPLNLNGNWKWDVAKYTDFLVYNYNTVRGALNDTTGYGYAYGNITVTPDYDGDADEIHKADRTYKYGATSAPKTSR